MPVRALRPVYRVGWPLSANSLKTMNAREGIKTAAGGAGGGGRGVC